jgi:hypothetical protein
MYCYVMRLCSHSADHKYYNVVECHDLGVVKRRAASVFSIGMENVLYPEDWHNAVL